MRALVVLSLIFAAACQPPPAQTAAADAEAQSAEAAANGCPAQASSSWQEFQIEAVASGADCAQARATLTIRNDDGAVLHTATVDAAQTFGLAGAESVADMERRLHEWAAPPGAAMDSTGDLPIWAANAERPGEGESAFHPEAGIDRASYEALRGGDAPMFCFAQGMESQVCLFSENGVVRKIGMQTFPG